MLFPRLFALSEVAWGTSQPERYKAFENRVVAHMTELDRRGINYGKAIFEVSGNNITKNGKTYYELSTINKDGVIRYTIDGSTPTVKAKTYIQPILLEKSMKINAAAFSADKMISPVLKQEFSVSKSTGKRIEIVHAASSNYPANGPASLVDGIYGNRKQFKKDWLGFNGKDLIATVDLGMLTGFSTVALNTVDQKGSWIHYPQAVKVYVSNDGKTFKLVSEIGHTQIDASEGSIALHFPEVEARFVRVEVQHAGKIPNGFPGAGYDSWLFVDELSVY